MRPLPVGTRFVAKAFVVVTALQLTLTFVFGWQLASLMIAAAYCGFVVGQGRGFKNGLDNATRSQLTSVNDVLGEMEQQMAGELAPDHPDRVAVAQLRGILSREIASIR